MRDTIPTREPTLEGCLPPSPPAAAASTETAGVTTACSRKSSIQILDDAARAFAKQLARIEASKPWSVIGGITRARQAVGIQDEDAAEAE